MSEYCSMQVSLEHFLLMSSTRPGGKRFHSKWTNKTNHKRHNEVKYEILIVDVIQNGYYEYLHNASKKQLQI